MCDQYDHAKYSIKQNLNKEISAYGYCYSYIYDSWFDKFTHLAVDFYGIPYVVKQERVLSKFVKSNGYPLLDTKKFATCVRETLL